MPMPSGGCQTCRARHIKCDETRPTCLNCRKSGKNCAGWRTGTGSLLFLDENIYASTEIRRPKGGARWVPEFSAGNFSDEGRRTTKTAKRRSVSTEAPLKSSHAADLRQAIRSEVVFNVPPSLQPPLKDLAVSYFAKSYFRRNLMTAESLWTILGNYMLASGPSVADDSSLQLSLSALSLAHYARSHQVPAAMLEAQLNYSHALKRIRSSIENSHSTLADELLISVMIMAAYENNSCNSDEVRIFTHEFQHHKGAIALLKLRRENRSGPAAPNSIDQGIRRQVIKACIYRALALPEWLRNGIDFGEQEYQADLDRGVVGLACLRHRALSVLEICRSCSFSCQETIAVELESLIHVAVDLLDDLEEWRLMLDPVYHFKTVHGDLDQVPTSLLPLFHTSEIHQYSDIDNAAMWSRYWGARLFINCLLTKILFEWKMIAGSDSERYDSVQLRAEMDVYHTADEVCSAVPSSFEVDFQSQEELSSVLKRVCPARVYSLVWPIISIAASPLVCKPQRLWVVEKLALIGKVTGNAILQKLPSMNLQDHSMIRKEALRHATQDPFRS